MRLRARLRNWWWCRRHGDLCARLTALFATLPADGRPKSDEFLEAEAAIWEDSGDAEMAALLRQAKVDR